MAKDCRIVFFFFQAEDGIRDIGVTGVQTCALPIFVRGLMRSAAGLSYERAQAAIDGNPDDEAGPLMKPVLEPLWAAYRAMLKGRQRSGERRVGEEGRFRGAPYH